MLSANVPRAEKVGSLLREAQRRNVVMIITALSLGVDALLGLRSAHGAEHEINTHGTRWVPIVLFVEPGDTVIWRGMDGHETQLIEGFSPDGTPAWQSALGEEGFRVTLERAGAYIYKCETHMNTGMVGAIVVGREAGNLAAIEAALPAVETGRAFLQGLMARLKRELNRRSAP